MRKQNLAVAFVVIVLAGCGAVPMTTSEFRQAVKQEGRNIDSLSVNRPFGDVTRTFQKMSNECLNFSITSVERSGGLGGGTRSNTWAWGRSSVAVSPKHAELRLQRKVKDQIGTIPADGMYYLVADVTPAGADKTNVKIYYWDSVKVAATAIKGWAGGTMLGCPDPANLF